MLQASSAGANPLEGVVDVQIPKGTNLDYGSPEYDSLEALGVEEIPFITFVLVAGGLGERLGYSGVKLSLPIDIGSEATYLCTYCKSILALQAMVDGTTEIPLVVMTSDDTHDRTVGLLEANSYFGMTKGQVRLIKQEKVAALTDNRASIASDGPFRVLTKPHGHGDVHLLLHQEKKLLFAN